MSAPRHTPTPWSVHKSRIIIGPSNGLPSPDVIARVTGRRNAAFIVRAVNSHAALLAALEHAEAVLAARGGPSDFDERTRAAEKARAAIVQAEGEGE